MLNTLQTTVTITFAYLSHELSVSIKFEKCQKIENCLNFYVANLFCARTDWHKKCHRFPFEPFLVDVRLAYELFVGLRHLFRCAFTMGSFLTVWALWFVSVLLFVSSKYNEQQAAVSPRPPRRYWYYQYLWCTHSRAYCILFDIVSFSLVCMRWKPSDNCSIRLCKINLNGFGGLKLCSLQAKINGSRNVTSVSSEVTNDSVDHDNGVNACTMLLCCNGTLRLGNSVQHRANSNGKCSYASVRLLWVWVRACGRAYVWCVVGKSLMCLVKLAYTPTQWQASKIQACKCLA